MGDPEFDGASLERLRRRSSSKWTRFDPDVLPAWIAEMDWECGRERGTDGQPLPRRCSWRHLRADGSEEIPGALGAECARRVPLGRTRPSRWSSLSWDQRINRELRLRRPR